MITALDDAAFGDVPFTLLDQDGNRTINMPSPALAKGLEFQQVGWARQHDWFLGFDVLRAPTHGVAGLYRVKVRPDTADSRTEFTDFQELREWAGY
jgi:hypothetical protein